MAVKIESSQRDKLRSLAIELDVWIPLEAIFESYEHAGRIYHNYDHLFDMMDVGSMNSDLFVAILFHDIHYEYGRPFGYNEMMSAAKMAPFVRDVTIFEAIYFTAFHADPRICSIIQPHQWLVRELMDRDLFSFSKSYDEFMRDNINVQKEISLHTGKPVDEISQNQLGFFDKLLARPALYFNHRDWEDQARSNLIRRREEIVQASAQ